MASKPPAGPRLWIVRHGETEWTVSRRHTGATDILLTDAGEAQARGLGRRLAGRRLKPVLCSPLARARDTAELALPGAQVVLDPDLIEWDYGDYEGITTAEILRSRPDWDLWRDGCPGGETAAQVATRCDRVLARLRAGDGSAGESVSANHDERAPTDGAIVFGHGHASRVLAARALGLDATVGAHLRFSTAAVSIICAEHDHPAIERWNDTGHLVP